MDNNDVMRRLRYALDIKDANLLKLFQRANTNISVEQISGMLKKPEEPGFVICSDSWLHGFLDALIEERRGPRQSESPSQTQTIAHLNNNLILKKLRIALELREDELRLILKKGGIQLSKSELSALFRKRDHRNYKECGDQVLRNFMKGLALHYRYVMKGR